MAALVGRDHLGAGAEETTEKRQHRFGGDDVLMAAPARVSRMVIEAHIGREPSGADALHRFLKSAKELRRPELFQGARVFPSFQCELESSVKD
jgi:hypothetical protein